MHMPATNPLKLMCYMYNIIIYNSSLGYAIGSACLSDRLDRMSGSGERTINLRRGEVRVELRASQTTCHIIGRAFGLDPETIWLKEEYGTRAFFPDDGSNFTGLDAISNDYYSLTVEGVPVEAPQRSGTSSSSVSVLNTTTGTPTTRKPYFQPVINKSKEVYSLKVVLADLSYGIHGKPEFSPLESAYCEIMETTANATFISRFIRQEFDEEYVLVSNDGLEIKDFPGTRGKSFISCFVHIICMHGRHDRSHNIAIILLLLLSIKII